MTQKRNKTGELEYHAGGRMSGIEPGDGAACYKRVETSVCHIPDEDSTFRMLLKAEELKVFS